MFSRSYSSTGSCNSGTQDTKWVSLTIKWTWTRFNRNPNKILKTMTLLEGTLVVIHDVFSCSDQLSIIMTMCPVMYWERSGIMEHTSSESGSRTSCSTGTKYSIRWRTCTSCDLSDTHIHSEKKSFRLRCQVHFLHTGYVWEKYSVTSEKAILLRVCYEWQLRATLLLDQSTTEKLFVHCRENAINREKNSTMQMMICWLWWTFFFIAYDARHYEWNGMYLRKSNWLQAEWMFVMFGPCGIHDPWTIMLR